MKFLHTQIGMWGEPQWLVFAGGAGGPSSR